MMRLLATTIALLAAPGQLLSQELPLRPGDTVRVWQSGALKPEPSGMVTRVSSDTLVIDRSRLRVAEVARIDVARGTTMDRSRLTRYVATGAAVGLAAGLLAYPRMVCRGCDTIVDDSQTMPSFAANGAMLGAGVAYLIARSRATIPRWYTVWPMDSLTSRPVARRPDTTEVLTAAVISDVRNGDEMRIWQTDSMVRRGRFDRLTPEGAGLLLRDNPTPFRLSSIDVLEVGRRRTTEGALFGTAILGFPTLLVAGIACGLAIDGCDGEDVLAVVGVGAAVGFSVGALIGHSHIRWQVRFSR